MESWRLIVLLLFFLVFVVALEEWCLWPSCETTTVVAASTGGTEDDDDDLKVMMAADLLLLGPNEPRPSHLYFRDPYISRFLKKSFQKLKLDMLVVMGDISANGSRMANSKWIRLLKQFQKMLGPFTGYPIHIVLGDRDIEDCETMDPQSIRWISKNLPGLNPSDYGAFEIANVSFVSLNSIAMPCEDTEAYFNVEKTIERESLNLQAQVKDKIGDFKVSASLSEFIWRDNPTTSGSGPVLLLHLPLYLNTQRDCSQMHAIGNSCEAQEALWKLNFCGHNVGSVPYELTQSLPMNVTKYVF